MQRNPRQRPRAAGGRPRRNELRQRDAGPIQLPPRSASHLARSSVRGVREGGLGRAVEGVVVPVAAPLPDVARHVVQAEGRHPEQVVHVSHRQTVNLIGCPLEMLAESQPVGRGRIVAPGNTHDGRRLGRRIPIALRSAGGSRARCLRRRGSRASFARWPRANRRSPHTTRRGSLATVRCPRAVAIRTLFARSACGRSAPSFGWSTNQSASVSGVRSSTELRNRQYAVVETGSESIRNESTSTKSHGFSSARASARVGADRYDR